MIPIKKLISSLKQNIINWSHSISIHISSNGRANRFNGSSERAANYKIVSRLVRTWLFGLSACLPVRSLGTDAMQCNGMAAAANNHARTAGKQALQKCILYSQAHGARPGTLLTSKYTN